jgi:hypothetical protein
MEEIVPDHKKAVFVANNEKCAKRLYDIRDDVRVFIKCTFIMEEWEKSYPDHFKAKKSEESNATKENGEK